MSSTDVRSELRPARAAGIAGVPHAGTLDWVAVRARPASAQGIVLALAAACCLLHLLCNFRYGYFRDELYFAACGEHLAWGYVDQAPLIALVARLSRTLLGDSLASLRLLPALAAGASALLGGALARELGGGRYAQALAALCVLCAPIYLTFGNLLTMNAFEPALWTGCALAAVCALRTGIGWYWLAFGALAGIGLENKHSMFFFGSGIFLGLLLGDGRREFTRRWIWLGAAVAFALFLPNLLWQARHGWPTLEFLDYRRNAENIRISPFLFIAEQALLTLPFAAGVALAGLGALLFGPAFRPWRFLGWGYLVVLAEQIALSGKIYYLAPYYVILFAAGAVCLEQWLAKRGRGWARATLAGSIAVSAALAAPLALPLLPVEAAARYARFWHIDKIEVEVQPRGDMPQLFADMFGWENQVATIARAFRRLPPAEQKSASILAGSYGEAGAVDYFGPHYGLPKVVCAENAYYLWGPHGASDETVIAIGIHRQRLLRLFEDVQAVDVIRSEHAMPDENNLPVYLCRRPRMTFEQAWGMLHTFG